MSAHEPLEHGSVPQDPDPVYLPLGFMTGPWRKFDGGQSRALSPVYHAVAYEGSTIGALMLIKLGLASLWQKACSRLRALVHPAIAVLLALLLLAPQAFAATPAPAPSAMWLAGVVVKVSDGDTVTVQVGASGAFEKVRMVGIDAPEKAQPKWGLAARMRLTDLVYNRPVEIEPFSAKRPRDLYGRLLGWVHTGGINVNRVMVVEGLALARNFGTRIPGFEALVVSEQAARSARVGLWSDASFVEPAVYRKQHGIGRNFR